MQHLLLFLEGVITFISPCILPLLPLYLSYFAAGKPDKKKTVLNAAGFVTGFTIVFVTLGAFAGRAGGFIQSYAPLFNLAAGAVVILFGLNFLGVFNLGFLNRSSGGKVNLKDLGFFNAVLFGLVFSISWTPCVGAFLGSALLIASLEGSLLKGVTLLLAFSLGLGVPFIAAALLIDQLKGAFDLIKKNYRIINFISGALLVAIGILMMTGYLGRFLSILTF